jgi:alginate O-acetyltransferase complex protein AlgI
MIFNSIVFILFLFIVYISYWSIGEKNRNQQNILIVIASYFFYGWWDWRFLSLLIISTLTDYSIGLFLRNENSQRKRLLYLSISLIVNLGLLGIFKYFNFFLENLNILLDNFNIQLRYLNVVLPVGISFYTFQTLSYTIDVYKKKYDATDDIISFAAYVAFFPQLVAGPIERAIHLLPQFQNNREFSYSYSVEGMQQILWGFFKKLVIADNVAQYVNHIYSSTNQPSGSTYVLATIFFSFQIYCDFSGYSDIAIGVSKLFGFDLMQNFKTPYFARDIAEFWRRWHISLTTWFRDYVYIPLGGSRRSLLRVLLNTIIVFLVSGFWHGAKWTFFGLGYNKCYLLFTFSVT